MLSIVLSLYIVITIEAKSIASMAERNRMAAEKWKKLTEDEKSVYVSAAKQGVSPQPSLASYDSHHEAQRIVSNMKQNVRII